MKDRKVQRVLAVKCDVDWKDESSKKLYNRLRDLSWQAARYKNGLMRRTWATLTGYRHPDAPEEMNKIRNQWREDCRGGSIEEMRRRAAAFLHFGDMNAGGKG